MRNGKKRAIALSLCGAVAAGVAGVAFWLFGTGVAESSTISAGLQYLSERAHVACAAPVGEDVSFSPEWFDKALSGGAVSAVTVTALPPVTEGKLMLGYGEVSVGQSIRRDNLSYLYFKPCEGVLESEFSFLPETVEGKAGYTYTCRLSLTEGVNCCPVGKGSTVAVSTHSTLSYGGRLEVDDPEGDDVYFEVVSYPQNGTLSLDAETGAFSYLPTGDFSGEDAFVWRAQDAHGAFSEVMTVSITVNPLSLGYCFSDMEGNGAHSAALTVTEAGLMSGEVLGGKHYFHPQRALTRAAFVAIILAAAEVEYPAAESTGYVDDADVPAPMKGAVKYAKEKGWLGEGNTFRPNDPITRAEAASIASRVLGFSAPGYGDAVKDHAGIPVGVVDALYAAYEGGYISVMADGTLSPAATLSRGDAARFFAKILEGK